MHSVVLVTTQQILFILLKNEMRYRFHYHVVVCDSRSFSHAVDNVTKFEITEYISYTIPIQTYSIAYH
jgi:hypothetical protein